MSIFSLSDVTPVGAFCNAMEAAGESDRRAARPRRSASDETTRSAPTVKVSISAVRKILAVAWGRIGRVGPAETA